MLKETSMLFHHFQIKDISILSTTGTWLLRLQIQEILKYGISTNNQGQSGQDTTTNPGTSPVQVDQAECKSGAQTLDGGRSSNTQVNTSAIFNNRIDA
jgi:hypothetical protein